MSRLRAPRTILASLKAPNHGGRDQQKPSGRLARAPRARHDRTVFPLFTGLHGSHRVEAEQYAALGGPGDVPFQRNRTCSKTAVVGDQTMSLRTALTLVLAAGEGTRMRSRQPKVLHAVGGRPLIAHVLAAVGRLGGRTAVVVGPGPGQVDAEV